MQSLSTLTSQKTTMLATMYIGEQVFGLPILTVRDILIPEKIFTIPMAPQAIAGVINLRGRIVTVIDMHQRFAINPVHQRTSNKIFCVTVQSGNELYGLIFDRVGDVIEVTPDQFEPVPSTLNRQWRECCQGVYRLNGQLLLVLDVDILLDTDLLCNAQIPTTPPKKLAALTAPIH